MQKAPIESGPSGNPARLDVSAVVFGEIERGQRQQCRSERPRSPPTPYGGPDASPANV
jgi:hypothetical protein